MTLNSQEQAMKDAAEAATPGDLDTVANPPTEYGGREKLDHYECPACHGEGEVDGVAYYNFDHVSMGVQFFGIGVEFGKYETFFRAANPAAVLELLATVEALRGERDALAPDKPSIHRRQQLQCVVEGDRLVISIGVNLTAFAIQLAEHSWDPTWEITDIEGFVGDMADCLLYEGEDGTTPIHRMLEAAAIAAVEWGSENMREDGDAERGAFAAQPQEVNHGQDK